MPARRFHPPFDHGAALRVPPPGDAEHWRVLWSWLGAEARSVDPTAIQVSTPEGPVIAHSGDWIVLSHSGEFHVAHSLRACDA